MTAGIVETHPDPAALQPPVISEALRRRRLFKILATGDGARPSDPTRGTDVTNTILNVAVHDLKRDTGGMSVQIGRADLKITPAIQRVIDELHALYGKRATKAFGRFSSDANNFPTEGYLRTYIDDGDFGEMTRLMMTTLQTKANARPNVGSGHVFFAHVENEKGPFLLIAILNDRLGAALTATYEVHDANHLDLDGFRFAGRIGIRGWQEGDKHYIGFLKGRGDVAEYFREFLGCNATVLSKAETDVFVKTLQAFTVESGMPVEERAPFLKRARDISAKPARERAELDFTALANEVAPNDPERLLTFLSDPDRGLSDGFVPDLGVLNALSTYRAKTPLWSLFFERDALLRGEIAYDHEEGTLTIKKLPPELVRALRAEVSRAG